MFWGHKTVKYLWWRSVTDERCYSLHYAAEVRYSRIVGTEGVDKCFIIMRCSADVIRLSGV